MNDVLISLMGFSLLGVLLGVPVIALSLRFALKPLVEAWVRLRETQQANPQELALMKQQLALLSERMEEMEQGLHQLKYVAEFDRELNLPPGGGVQNR
ncbi:MAG: hypothetical protein P8099_10325 [Gemmatimonadota bacterium]